MKLDPSISIEDLAYIVCTALHQAGATAVLSGGGAATLYAPNAYMTRDLDFVLDFRDSRGDEQIVLELGYQRSKTGGTYVHPQIPYSLEFPPGPLAVGDEQILVWDTWTREDQVLHIINPSDCVRDRLSAAIHWNDLSSARQAAEVAKLHEVDMELIEAWCEREGGRRSFSLFRSFMKL